MRRDGGDVVRAPLAALSQAPAEAVVFFLVVAASASMWASFLRRVTEPRMAYVAWRGSKSFRSGPLSGGR